MVVVVVFNRNPMRNRIGSRPNPEMTNVWEVFRASQGPVGITRDEVLSTHDTKSDAVSAARRHARQGEQIEVKNKTDGNVKVVRQGEI